MTSTKRVSFIELAIKKCQNEYSLLPCTAAIGVTGEQKCFNSRATCQDKPNLNEADEIIRFAKPSSNIRFDLDANPNSYLPNIESISYTPSALDLGNSIGERGTLSVTFKDHRSPDTDASGDPYIIARDYDPYERGTYWGKFRARHPFIRGQSIWLVQGTSDQLISEMERQEFIVESTAGPDAGGVYRIVAKDILKLAQGDRANAPVASQGYLQSAITAAATSATLAPSGIGATYPASGKIAIGGDEIADFTRSGDALTLVRAQNNTEAKDHDAESRVQLCLVYAAQKPSAIFEDLLTNYTPITANYIPSADWESESDTQLNRVYSTVIAQPTPVKQLIDELLEQTGSSMYWDGFNSLIRWTVLKNPSADAEVFEPTNVMQNTFNIKDQLGKRVTQVWVYYGQINPLLNLTDTRNYASGYVDINDEAEEENDNTPAIKQVFSRWILADARDTADRLAELVLSRYSTPPRKLGFRLLRDSLPSIPTLAGSYQFKNEFIQDETGLMKSIPIQVTSVNRGAANIEVMAEEVTFTAIGPQDPNQINLYPSDGALNYNIYDAYFAQVGQAPTAATVVNVIVDTDFTIGSASTGLASLTTGGPWPVGATINITNRGFIVGRGGDGGNGADVLINISSQSTAITTVRASASGGANGGDAISVSDANILVNLTNSGVIGGGGGGGGGAGHGMAFSYTQAAFGDFSNLSSVGGSGGAGGAGYPAGSGGVGFNDSVSVSSSVSILIETTKSGSVSGGLSGSLSIGGNGPSQVSAISGTISQPPFYSFSLSAISSNPGGGGGDLGFDGSAGRDGTGTATASGSSTGSQSSSSGGAGGLAGNAIVQNGNLINIITAGDIRGAIV